MQDMIYTTPEHELLREQVARFIAREVEPHGDQWEEQGCVPRDVLRRMGQAGFFGLMYEPQYGGAGADAMTHAVEAFTAAHRATDGSIALDHVFVGKNPLTDHFALLAIRLLARSLRKAVENGSDADARADVMMGAMAAGAAFGTAGTAAATNVRPAVEFVVTDCAPLVPCT